MSAPSICARLLEQYPRSFVEEAGVPTRPSTPRAAFQLLCAALLFGARIRIDVAQRTVRALKAAGWTTPSRLLDAGEAQRVAVLTASGYGRYADAKAAQALAAAGLPRTGRGLARHVDSPAQLCRIIDGAIRRERGVRGRASA